MPHPLAVAKLPSARATIVACRSSSDSIVAASAGSAS